MLSAWETKDAPYLPLEKAVLTKLNFPLDQIMRKVSMYWKAGVSSCSSKQLILQFRTLAINVRLPGA